MRMGLMNAQCAVGSHNYVMVYPDQDLIDGIIFEQSIEEIWECTRCGKAKAVMGTVGEIVPH
jgi:hypothetical protein